MEKIEKVITAMECCAVGAECDHCPYSMLNKEGYEGCHQMHWDALELLKEQQAIIDELLKVGYPHNFQREEPWIVNYMLKITEVVKKAVHLRNGEKDGEQE